jgi:hypothetical protein
MAGIAGFAAPSLEDFRAMVVIRKRQAYIQATASLQVCVAANVNPI